MRIELDDDRRWYLPGENVSGRIIWNLDVPADAVELRLFWHTSGKGTEDVEIIDDLRVDAAGTSGERDFSFCLPLGPYSFSGSLITLAWALELMAFPGGEIERVELVVAPTPVELRLETLDREPLGHTFNLNLGPKKR